MSLGWFDSLANAKAYFALERLVKTAWDALSDADKSIAVKMGYNRIYHDERYSPPTYAAATADQLVALKIVNGEMAYYLAVHLADEDRRKGLQAQAVEEAGIVKEIYDEDKLYDLPVPPAVHAILDGLGLLTATGFAMIDIDRDEDESVNTKVDDF